MNTLWIQGVVVYTGHDTKIMLNSVKARPKKSRLETLMNSLILIIFAIQMGMCFFASLCGQVWYQYHKDQISYLEIPDISEYN